MTTSSSLQQRQHIATDPETCGGRPRISGTRIRVQDIYVWNERMGISPDQIVHEFPQLTLADVYAALAYFWDNREAMLEQMDAERGAVAQDKVKTPSILQGKLHAMRNDGSSISS